MIPLDVALTIRTECAQLVEIYNNDPRSIISMSFLTISKSISCRWYCQCSLEYLHYTNRISMMGREKMYALPVPSRIRQTHA